MPPVNPPAVDPTHSYANADLGQIAALNSSDSDALALILNGISNLIQASSIGTLRVTTVGEKLNDGDIITLSSFLAGLGVGLTVDQVRSLNIVAQAFNLNTGANPTAATAITITPYANGGVASTAVQTLALPTNAFVEGSFLTGGQDCDVEFKIPGEPDDKICYYLEIIFRKADA